MFRFKPSLKMCISWSRFALLPLSPCLSIRRSFPLAPFAQPCCVPKVQRLKKEGKLQPGNTVPRKTCPLCFGIIAVLPSVTVKGILGGICVKGLPVCGASSLGSPHPLVRAVLRESSALLSHSSDCLNIGAFGSSALADTFPPWRSCA